LEFIKNPLANVGDEGESKVSYLRKLMKGAAIVFGINFVAGLIGYITKIYFARNLTPEEYGLFFAVLTLITFITLFKNCGLWQALAKFIPEYLIKKQYGRIKSAILKVTCFNLAIAVALSVVLYFLSGTLAVYYFKNPMADWLLKAFIAIFILITFRNILRAIFRGFQKMLPFAMVYLTENIIILLVAWIFFSFELGLKAPVGAYIIAYVLVFVIFSKVLLSVFPLFKHREQTVSAKKLFGFGIPVLFTGVGDLIILYVDILILTAFVPLGQVGIYSVCVATAMLLTYISKAVIQPLFPMVAELTFKKKNKELKELISYTNRGILVLAIPIAGAMVILARYILNKLFGETYVSGAPVLKMLIVGVCFLIPATLNLHVIAALGKPKSATKIVAIGAIVNVLANFYFIPVYGIIGAAYTSLGSYVIIYFLSTIKLRRLLK